MRPVVRFHLGPPLQVLQSPRLRKVRVVDLRGESPMRFSGVVRGRDRLRFRQRLAQSELYRSLTIEYGFTLKILPLRVCGGLLGKYL